MIILGTVIIWSNGTVIAFDLDGNQVPEFQGEFRFVGVKLMEAVSPETALFFGSWNPPQFIPLVRGALGRMAAHGLART